MADEPVTGLTVVTVLVVVAALLGRLTYGQALAIGGATPSGAALIVGRTAVPTFYAIAIGAGAALALAVLRRGRSASREREWLPPGALPLVFFLVWSIAITLTAPILFDGLPVVNSTTSHLTAGYLSSSNVAQIGYLLLGVCVVVYLARSPDTGPGLVGTVIGICLVLSLASYLADQTGLPFPRGFFDSSPDFAYIQTAAGGSHRVRGITSEPAALAVECVTGLAYFLTTAVMSRGWRRVSSLGLAAVAFYLGIVSTSATFVVAGVASAAILLGAALFNFVGRRASVSLAISILTCAIIVAGILLSSTAFHFVHGTVTDKVASSSYNARSSTDTVSLRIFMQTYGLGVGLGSARGSSFLPTLLSATGILGATLYFTSIASIWYAARREPAIRSVSYALVALLVVKATSGPDISDSTGLVWLCLGVLSRAGLRSLGTPNRRSEPTRSHAVSGHLSTPSLEI